jgi:hypothetical protein
MADAEQVTLPTFFTPQQIAASLQLSEETVRTIFQDMPGVVKISKPRLRGTREYKTLRIPPAVFERFLRDRAA